jgi:Gas vesicle protein
VNTEPALTTEQRVTLVELVDRVLDKGVVISGDVTLAVADVDLVYLRLRALLASVASTEREGRTEPFPPPEA